MADTFNILALSGGGVRGVFQSEFLERFQSDETLRNVRFDLFAGTSTGSITAAALALGRPAREVSNLFEQHLRSIFPHRGFWLFLHAITSSRPFFDIKKLSVVLDKEFNNNRMADANINLIINSTSLEGFEPKTFSNISAAEGSHLRIVDAVIASCAAPIFFLPHKIDEYSQNFLDGGLWANNPILVAIDYAIHNLGISPHLIRVFSLGTGEVPPGTTLSEINNTRHVGFAAIGRVLEMYNSSQSLKAIGAAQSIVGSSSIVHINPTLKKAITLYDAKNALEVLPGMAQNEFWKTRESLIDLFFKEHSRDSEVFDRLGLITDEMIHVSGLSKFMPKRRFYQKFRNGNGDIESYLETALYSIEMISINLSTGNFFEDICRVFKRKLKNPNFRIHISLLDPDDFELMCMISTIFATGREESVPDGLSESIKKSMERLMLVREQLDDHHKSRFLLSFHNSIPFGSAIILDAESSSARIQVETKPYKAPIADSFAFEVVPSHEDALFHTLLKSYRELLSDGRVC